LPGVDFLKQYWYGTDTDWDRAGSGLGLAAALTAKYSGTVSLDYLLGDMNSFQQGGVNPTLFMPT